MAIKLTELGRALRELRVVRGEVLFDMAEKLRISTSMLSAIEIGTKQAPNDFVQKLAEHYEAVADDQARFARLAELTRKHVKIRLDSGNPETREMKLEFAKKADDLNTADVEAIRLLLSKY